MVLLRHEIGEAIRAERRQQGRTLRDISAAAAVSLGYLSEIERGTKEPSSEMLAAICAALGLPLSRLLTSITTRVADAERLAAPVPLRSGGEPRPSDATVAHTARPAA